jgi:hypothetical protein
LGRCHSSPAARETQGNRRQDTGSQLHRKRSPRRPTPGLRGRRRAKRDGNRTAGPLFGAPFEPLVRPHSVPPFLGEPSLVPRAMRRTTAT